MNPYLDDKFLGSGDFTAGNPFASPDDGKTYFEGGGSGCHSFNSPGEALGKVGYAHQLGRITWNGGNARIQDKYCQRCPGAKADGLSVASRKPRDGLSVTSRKPRTGCPSRRESRRGTGSAVRRVAT